jgi:hypothetical protein
VLDQVADHGIEAPGRERQLHRLDIAGVDSLAKAPRLGRRALFELESEDPRSSPCLQTFGQIARGAADVKDHVGPLRSRSSFA